MFSLTKLDKIQLTTILELKYNLRKLFMVQGCSLFVTENEVALASIASDKNFLVGEVYWTTDKQNDERLYQQTVYKVSTKPKLLISHLQRIYFTYSHNMADQLYAALVDLFSVLDGRGKELSGRMVSSTRSLLSEEQLGLLVNYLKHPKKSLLHGNNFSVLTTGLVGSGILLIEQKNVEAVAVHDPLVIARDYVEYSQLDSAIETLEAGVLEDPDREDLQTDLLELYKVTKNIQAFSKFRDLLIEKKLDLSSGWQDLTDYFAELTNEK